MLLHLIKCVGVIVVFWKRLHMRRKACSSPEEEMVVDGRATFSQLVNNTFLEIANLFNNWEVQCVGHINHNY